MSEFLRNNWTYLIGAALLHIVFAGIFGLTLITIARQPQPATLAIQAVVVDRSVIDRAARQQQRERTQEREKQQAEQRKQQERREAEQRADQERLQEQKQAEEQQQRRQVEEQHRQVEEQQARERQEAERKAEAQAQADTERQRKAEAERKRVAEIERKQKEEAERRKAADDSRLQQQRESELHSQIEEEEGRSQAENAGLLNQYIAMIEQRIVRNWNRPPSARTGLECRVRVTQTPGGTVLSAQIEQCNGDTAVKQSIEAAVMRSSPLPPPPDPRLFERTLVLVFKPTDE
jgi:colicin import membrane protein